MWMGLWPEDAIYLPWDIWIVTWFVAALWANRTLKHPGFGRELPYRLVTIAGFVLLLGGAIVVRRGHYVLAPFPGILGMRNWRAPLPVEWAMVGIAALGFLFCWWARIHLGRLWSGRITRKEGHRVVDSGPYAIVRHPIYTGIIVASFASAVVMGGLHAILGAALITAGYWMKARVEENWLRAELGPETYDAYRRRVPMLVPLGPKSA